MCHFEKKSRSSAIKLGKKAASSIEGEDGGFVSPNKPKERREEFPYFSPLLPRCIRRMRITAASVPCINSLSKLFSFHSFEMYVAMENRAGGHIVVYAVMPEFR